MHTDIKCWIVICSMLKWLYFHHAYAIYIISRGALASVWGVFLFSVVISKFLTKMTGLPPCLPVVPSLLPFPPLFFPPLSSPSLPIRRPNFRMNKFGECNDLFNNLSLSPRLWGSFWNVCCSYFGSLHCWPYLLIFPLYFPIAFNLYLERGLNFVI